MPYVILAYCFIISWKLDFVSSPVNTFPFTINVGTDITFKDCARSYIFFIVVETKESGSLIEFFICSELIPFAERILSTSSLEGLWFATNKALWIASNLLGYSLYTAKAAKFCQIRKKESFMALF